MSHIYAEIPKYQGPGLGGGFDLVQQITVSGLQRIFRSIDMNRYAAAIPNAIERQGPNVKSTSLDNYGHSH